MRFVLAPASANVQNKYLIPQRMHESLKRRTSVDIEIDVAVVSGLRFQGRWRVLRHKDSLRFETYSWVGLTSAAHLRRARVTIAARASGTRERAPVPSGAAAG